MKAGVSGSSPRLLHTTIARNGSASLTTGGSDGSGLYVVTGPWGGQSAVALTNTILVSHTVGITVAANNEARLTATLWGTGIWANLADWGGAGTISTGTINLWGNPVFVDPDARDYHIGSASAARDVITSTACDARAGAGVKHDIDGQMRPMDWGYDLGADEFPGVGLDVVKGVSTVSANPGQVLTYTILVTSAGAENATGIVLTDTLDSWQRPIGATSSVGGCSITAGGWGGAVVCSLGTLVPGATARVTLTAQVSTTVTLRQAMTNTVVVSHSVGVLVTAGDSARLDTTLWCGNTPNWAGEGTVESINGLRGLPMFAADGYHVMATSGAIDRGIDAGVMIDIDGDARPQGRSCDLGADEYVGPAVKPALYLPLAVQG